MRLTGGAHLTYCTNIHAGETWPEVRANLERHVLAVKRQVCPEAPFGVGLRLSAVAARALAAPDELARFRAFLKQHDLYVFTINGFPYGPFHGTTVKEQVYRPDWREDERVAYSDELAQLFAGLLADSPGLAGSISTVPLCFKGRGPLSVVAPELLARLFAHVITLWRLREQNGADIALALEPEPECVLETVAETVRFFEESLLSRAGLAQFAGLTGLSGAQAEETLRHHLGVCLDACHAAVEFEEPDEAVAAFERAGVRIAKLQVSSGLRVVAPSPSALAALERFAEGVYLHQVVIRRGDRLERILDLPEALARARREDLGDEWRIHFHVPLFQRELPPFFGTQEFLTALLERQAARPFTQHLEVETYTWDVLPEEHRGQPVDRAIARELVWTRDRLEARTR